MKILGKEFTNRSLFSFGIFVICTAVGMGTIVAYLLGKGEIGKSPIFTSDNTTVSSRPCDGKSGTNCKFDTRTLAVLGGKTYDSITLDGKYWNIEGNTVVSTGTLDSIARYQQGPCQGQTAGACKFDTRTVFAKMPTPTPTQPLPSPTQAITPSATAGQPTPTSPSSGGGGTNPTPTATASIPAPPNTDCPVGDPRCGVCWIGTQNNCVCYPNQPGSNEQIPNVCNNNQTCTQVNTRICNSTGTGYITTGTTYTSCSGTCGGGTICSYPSTKSCGTETVCTSQGSAWRRCTKKCERTCKQDGSGYNDPTYTFENCQGSYASEAACNGVGVYLNQTLVQDTNAQSIPVIDSVTYGGRYWNWEGETAWPGNGGNLADVPHYQQLQDTAGAMVDGPCKGKTGTGCNFDAREIYHKGGKLHEIIVAYGKYWRYEHSLNDTGGITMTRMSVGSNKALDQVSMYQTGACQGQTAGQCVIDSVAIYMDGPSKYIESITAYGKYWNFEDNGTVWGAGNASLLTSVAKYNSAVTPPAGSGTSTGTQPSGSVTSTQPAGGGGGSTGGDAGKPGDFDGSGKITMADFVRFVGNYAQDGCEEDFDKDKDCKTDIGDATLFFQYYAQDNK